jgi:hypothetical protein
MLEPELRRQMGGAGRERVCAKFDQRFLAHHVLSIYQEVLGMPRSEEP